MYSFAVGSGYYEDKCGEGAGERSEAVGTGRSSRWVRSILHILQANTERINST
jgi:hypothetical protein